MHRALFVVVLASLAQFGTAQISTTLTSDGIAFGDTNPPAGPPARTSPRPLPRPAD